MARKAHGTGYFEDDPENETNIIEELFNIGPGKRFFFFNSLLENNFFGAVKAGAIRAYATGQGLFNIQEQTNLMNGKWDQKMNELRALVSGFQTYESANEQETLKIILSELSKTEPTLYEKFKDIIKDNQIDYPKYLTLLNSLDTDVQTAYDLIINMKETISVFNSTLMSILNSQKKLEKEDQYIYLESHRNEIVTKVREVLGEKQYSQISKNLASAIDDFIALEKNSNIDYIKQLENVITSMIQLGQNKNLISNTKSNLAQANSIKLQMLQKIRQYSISYNNNIEETLKAIQEAISEINKENSESEKMSPEQKQKNETINKLLQDLNFALKNYTKLQDQYNQLSKILNTSFLTARHKSSKQIAGLTKERRNRIIAALEAEGKNVEELKRLENSKKINSNGKEKGFDIRSKSDFEEYKKALEKIINNGEVLEIQDLIQTLDTYLQKSDKAIRKQTITLMTETSGGLGMKQITNKFLTLMGSENIKTDSITFLVGQALLDNPDYDATELEKIMTKISGKTRKILPHEIRLHNVETNRKGISYTAKGDIRATNALDDTFLKDAEKILKSREKAKKLLENTIIVEKSIKFADTFTEIEGGFHGGSLGANLDDVITNINDMIDAGGIDPIKDTEFLISAIMNAGPGMIGSGQKGALEMYLGAIASACMFTSGGNALKDYALQLNSQLPKSSGTKKIHVFIVGTKYIPLSYILKLVHEGMEKSINILVEKTQYNNKGAQVIIHNPVNEANDKITRTFVISNGKKIQIGDWNQTAEAGFPKITIEMGLLAGFLDTLDSIAETLKSLFL